jgi:pimeloyl-ACP methyl ester carboxylesterase
MRPPTSRPKARHQRDARPPAIGRRTFSSALVAGAFAAVVNQRVRADEPPKVARTDKPGRAKNVVLVHGAFADGSCWLEVIKHLQRAGLRATAVQNPLTSLADEVAATTRSLDLQDGPTVLVGHSWAGTVISEAGIAPKVTALVYVAARAPDAAEDYTALTKRFPTPPASAGIVHAGGFAQLDEKAFLNDFANGVDPATARALYAVQGRISDQLFASKTSAAAWRSKPSWYAVSKQDRTTHPDLERFLANRMNAHSIEVESGHLSMLTHPREISDLILSAAGMRT